MVDLAGSDQESETSSLREKAEKQLSAQATTANNLSHEKLLHELQVHQIELEMQNETLRQAQLALEESRDRYLDLYEFAPVGYLTLGDTGMIIEANLAAAALLGIERQRLIHRPFTSFLSLEDRDHWYLFSLGMLKQPGSQSSEWALQRSDDGPLYVQMNCISHQGHPAVIHIALIDITKRRQAEQALVEQEAKYRAIIETSRDGIWVLDRNGRLLVVNDAYARRSGYSHEELLSMRVSDLDVSESEEDARVHMDKIRREGGDLFVTRHRAKDGTIWPVEVNAAYSDAGEGCHFGFLRDISERKQAEAEMHALDAEMDQLTRFQVAKQTVSALAHELNQPLNAVTTYADAALRLLRRGNPQPDRLKHALESSSQQAHRAGEVVRELLHFLTQGDIKTEPLYLNNLIRRALDRVNTESQYAFSTDLQFEPDLPRVKANQLQIEKVLSNLIKNGVEAMHASPRSANLSIQVRTCSDPGMAQVTVRDTGPGIDPQMLNHVFDPFFTTKARGIGMGLAISRSMVEAHGGQLWVESEAGSGASFHFTLPFAS